VEAALQATHVGFCSVAPLVRFTSAVAARLAVPLLERERSRSRDTPRRSRGSRANSSARRSSALPHPERRCAGATHNFLNLKSDGCAVNASRAQSSSLQLPGIRLRARPIKNLQDGPELVPRISPRTVSANSRALAPKSRQSASFAIRERMMNLLTEVICRHLDHRWGEWQYETEGSCEQHQTCLRCQFVRRRFAAHQLSEPQYARPNSCERRRSCARCSYTERVETAHQWGADRQISECTTVKICSRCFTCSKPTSTIGGALGCPGTRPLDALSRMHPLR